MFQFELPPLERLLKQPLLLPLVDEPESCDFTSCQTKHLNREYPPFQYLGLPGETTARLLTEYGFPQTAPSSMELPANLTSLTPAMPQRWARSENRPLVAHGAHYHQLRRLADVAGARCPFYSKDDLAGIHSHSKIAVESYAMLIVKKSAFEKDAKYIILRRYLKSSRIGEGDVMRLLPLREGGISPALSYGHLLPQHFHLLAVFRAAAGARRTAPRSRRTVPTSPFWPRRKAA